ncbi:MAG: hypothetical protein MMC33_002565 [Icmadophila ericetorum]|nr:hypothetical protein [Icmadophila ericetorum]
MDSMRSLNKSLPSSSPKLKSTQPPDSQLLQAFKTAALTVTNLYKLASSDQGRIRQEGYQDALDELLTFLDKENLGLGDGEGWRVRQWATERLDSSPPVHAGSDSEDDRTETDKMVKSPSPAAHREATPESSPIHPTPRSDSPAQTEEIASTALHLLSQPSTRPTRLEDFSFRSSHSYPQDIEMQASDPADPPTDASPQILATATSQAVRVELLPRNNRTSHRYGTLSGRHNTRSGAARRNLGAGAGSKRKIPFSEFFDLGSLGDEKDGNNGGGKRGRLA